MNGVFRGTKGTSFFLGILLFGDFVTSGLPFPSSMPWAATSHQEGTTKRQGDAEQGRQVFNGKGICHYCHGIDGHKGEQPSLNHETQQIIAQLSPKPADLRNPRSLKLKTNKERVQAIKEGHGGTGMFPNTTLTDEEIKNLLAYLSTLRGE
jgi:mono/diheme cytochrome c family protein